jgi:carbon-monoxide dehydrogenase medium subunit
MKPAPFTYHDPRSRDELMALLGSLDDVKLLAGGQSLMPMLNLRLVAPSHVIDLNRIADLAAIRIDATHVEVGAMTRQAALKASDELAAVTPVIRQALAHVGHLQTRSRGTIGGSCCHLDPAAELPALCLLLDAQFSVLGTDGLRSVAAHDWFQGPLQADIGERELLQAIRWPRWPEGHGSGFHEFARRRGDFAVAGAAALLDRAADGSVRRAAAVVFGVAERPVRLAGFEAAVVGKRIDQTTLALAAEEAAALEAMEDAHVSAAYRARMGAMVVRRALGEAAGVTS